MRRQAIVWRESIYKNSFKCNKCGTALAKEVGNQVEMNEDIILFGEKFFCPECKSFVAYIEEVELHDYEEKMGAKLGCINERMN